MANVIFGGANKVVFHEYDGSAIGAVIHTMENIIDSSLDRQGDLSWNLSFTQEEDTDALNEFIEAAINADDSGGGSSSDRKYENGATAPSEPSSGSSSSFTLVHATVYGGKNASNERKLWAGFIKITSASGSYKQANGSTTNPTIAGTSVDAPIEVAYGSAGDIVLDATLVATAATETLDAGSKGRIFFPAAA